MLNTSLTVRLFKQKVRLNAGVKNILNVRQLQANNANGIHIEASNQQNLHWGRTFFTGLTWTI
jgi:outer membrane receptor protein involved in Fe transport